MALIQEELPPNAFVFSNFPDPKPTVTWNTSTAVEYDEYERQLFLIAGAMKKGQRMSKSQSALIAQLTRKFALERIQAASGFEIKDEKGSIRELSWADPADKAVILKALSTNRSMVGGVNLLVGTIMAAHRPANADVLAGDQLEADGEEEGADAPGN